MAMKQLVLLSKQEYEGLKHWGILGMKWGVRKEPERKGTKQKVKADAKNATTESMKSALKQKGGIENCRNYNGVVDKITIDTLNDKSVQEWQDAIDTYEIARAIYKQYGKELNLTIDHNMFKQKITDAATKANKVGAANGKKYEKEAKQALLKDLGFKVNDQNMKIFETDSKTWGKYFSGSWYAPEFLEGDSYGDDVEHSDYEDVIEHYGVPGMKWGIRKAIDNPFLRGMAMREASRIAYGPKYAGHTNKGGERGMVLAKRSARNDYANSEHLRRTIMRKAGNSDAYAKGAAGQKMDTRNPFKWYQNRRGMSDANSKRLADKGIERRSKYSKEYRNEIAKQRERTAKGNGQTRQTIRRLINQHSDVAFTVDFASGLANSLLYDL